MGAVRHCAKGADGLWYESIEALCKDLPKLLRGGDTVLVKASHSMQFEKITEFLKNRQRVDICFCGAENILKKELSFCHKWSMICPKELSL